MKTADVQIIKELNRIYDAQSGGGGGAAAFADITGDPDDNTNLAAALLLKQTAAQVQALIDAKVPYLVYTALLTQSATDAPVATVLQNTLGGTVVWTYSAVGVYLGTLAGAFDANKTACIISGVGGSIGSTQNRSATIARGADDDSVILQTFRGDTGADDGVLLATEGTTIEIRVYP